MKVRFARHTDRLDEIVRFYSDGVGLPVLGDFHDHAGYVGVFLDLSESGAHLEFTSGGGPSAPTPDPETVLVLYLEDEAERKQLAGRLAGREVTPSNP
ncbi:VOC family protein [Microbacterium testaceum]|uniref:VOC family protein n=1 Tax=Microbacterium testaceum TaxID=2033 RepID=UPI0012469E84|nr:VOC family protein [Microbacterium testaceum]